MPLLGIIAHDYICHEYVKPKNKIIDAICLILFYMMGFNVTDKRNYHIYHHIMWKDKDKDPTSLKLKNSSLVSYLLSTSSPVNLSAIPIYPNTLADNKIIKTLEQHYEYIYWLSRIVMLLFLPIEWFVVLVIYLPSIFSVIYNSFDYYFHGPINGKDNSMLFLIFNNTAWHNHHHNDWQTPYYGPNWFKWINPAWYYTLFLFNKNV
jgi:hypothetical protein